MKTYEIIQCKCMNFQYLANSIGEIVGVLNIYSQIIRIKMVPMLRRKHLLHFH